MAESSVVTCIAAVVSISAKDIFIKWESGTLIMVVTCIAAVVSISAKDIFIKWESGTLITTDNVAELETYTLCYW